MNLTLRKQKIFNSMSKTNKPYWSMDISNYKDKKDKITVFVNFSNKTPEPKPETTISKSGTSYRYIDIEEAECSLGCFNGKPQLTIFSYKLAEKEDNSAFGGESASLGQNIGIQKDDLPY